MPIYFNISKIKNCLTELKNLQTEEFNKLKNWDNIEETISEEEAEEIVKIYNDLAFPYEMILENIFNKKPQRIN